VIIWLWPQINGGFREIYSTASEAGRLALFDWTLDFSKDKTFWGASFNAFFIGLAVFGTDQELVQRLLTAEKRKSAQKALLGTIAAALPLLVLYLGIGTLLFVYFQQNPTLPTPAKGDEILPYFTAHILPVGMKGLVLAAVILASIDSPLASLASSFVTDIYRPLIRSAGTETHYLWVSRLCVGIFGVGLACAAFAFRQTDAILWVGFQVFSITGGATLGAFLLGILTRRPRAMDVVAGMLISTEVCAFLMYCLKAELIALGWTWVIVIGTGLTIVIGLMSSALEKPHQGSRAG
jgi:Na+/proline symporter